MGRGMMVVCYVWQPMVFWLSHWLVPGLEPAARRSLLVQLGRRLRAGTGLSWADMSGHSIHLSCERVKTGLYDWRAPVV